MNQNKANKSTFVCELPPTSRDVNLVQNKIIESNLGKPTYFNENWKLRRIFNIDNATFNKEFYEKQCELQNKTCLFNQWEVRYGFLTTIKESMIHKVAEEGLEVRLCPYNYFGHSISGIHISQNADVCMNEAKTKIGPDDEIILIMFKYMLGRYKSVPMYDPDTLMAPSPNYDSHLCQERPIPTENATDQYIKSLVYLYEFANPHFDPVVRPRHCCPISALIYKPARPYEMIDMTNNGAVPSYITTYEERPLSLLKPQKNWGRDFMLNPPPPSSNILIQKNERDDSRKVVVSRYDDQPSRNKVDDRIDRWDPIKYDYFDPSMESRLLDQNERSVTLRGQSRRDAIDSGRVKDGLLPLSGMAATRINPERDRSYDRAATARDGPRQVPNMATQTGGRLFSTSAASRTWAR